VSDQTPVNVDNSVIVNYLYSTVLSAATGGDAEFEHNKGAREYFQSPEIYVVAGGKAVGEFENLCERRWSLYQDIEDFLLETDDDIFEYHLGWGESQNSNDRGHLRKGVKYNMHMHESKAEQLSVIRRCFQQLEECKREILQNEIDETFEQYRNGSLASKINRELNIDHDAEILVDAVYLYKDHGIGVLAALDSDITTDGHREVLVELVHDEWGLDVDVRIIDPEHVDIENAV
jgi:hypothetical protein